jgi:type I restriction enzyme M protein
MFLVLKKCKKFDDVLCINAVDHFEKGKRQNNLLPEHIQKILDTYKHRKEENRYSRRVSMDEIEKNEFNLNISRYVSTSLDEEIIDLKVVNKKLVDLDKVINKAKETHNKYLTELGLPTI